METQLMIPSSAISSNTTPYVTAPSTPNRCHHNYFYSAPTSPILAGFQNDVGDDDFAFDFNGQLEPPAISDADELFHCGKIKTLNPLPYDHHHHILSPRSEAFSPRWAFDRTVGDEKHKTQNPPKRGRETTTRTRGKVSQSSSPFRISDILSEEEEDNITQKHSLSWYNKWNLKNLLLFRSTSEGSARRRKEPVNKNKYSRIWKSDEDVKNLSFRRRDNSCSSSGVGSSRRRKVSAHEMHYTVNRALAEEMRRKTYLPYKSGLLGCLGFGNNGGGSVHEISRGITSVNVMKQQRH